MSLSFVSSAVQIGTSDGGFEETAIENKETEAVNRRNAHKPLFEQLRSNQEEDQEKKEEMKRQIMRSTCALDDEDVAHLDALQKQRSDRERKIQERTKNELDSFRAARALRQQAALALASDHEEDDTNDSNNLPRCAITETSLSKETAVPTSSLPVIRVKKRKRRMNDSTETTQKPKTTAQESKIEQDEESEKHTREIVQASPSSNATGAQSTLKLTAAAAAAAATTNDGGGGLGSLLSGYGSSSDEE